MRGAVAHATERGPVLPRFAALAHTHTHTHTRAMQRPGGSSRLLGCDTLFLDYHAHSFFFLLRILRICRSTGGGRRRS